MILLRDSYFKGKNCNKNYKTMINVYEFWREKENHLNLNITLCRMQTQTLII